MLNEDIKNTVRGHYAEVARTDGGAGCAPGCCAPGAEGSLALGYSEEDIESVPDGANMGLGCGNPQAIAKLRAGETVVDLGSGGGFDCFLAGRQVGETGKVIGVDMTSEMIEKARRNAETLAASNVDFRLGEIEALPLSDNEADVILSNCVINLSPEKDRVFAEAFRVLAPGGRLAISDVVALQPLPEPMRERAEAISGCIAGAVEATEVERLLAEAGFEQVRVEVRPESRAFIANWFPGSGAEDYVASATIEAVKPDGASQPCCPPACCA